MFIYQQFNLDIKFIININNSLAEEEEEDWDNDPPSPSMRTTTTTPFFFADTSQSFVPPKDDDDDRSLFQWHEEIEEDSNDNSEYLLDPELYHQVASRDFNSDIHLIASNGNDLLLVKTSKHKMIILFLY